VRRSDRFGVIESKTVKYLIFKHQNGARAATDTLLVLLSNKATMLADTDGATRQRSLLRAKADGIAKRAGIIEKQMARLRS